MGLNILAWAKAKKYTDNAVSQTSGLHREIVNSLPATGDEHVIYMVPKTGSGNDNYDEYMWINSAYEYIGSTAVDLTDYYNKTQVDAMIHDLGGNEIVDDIDISNYDSSSNKYTCPSDGYIQMQIGPGEKGEACVDGYPLLWVRENEGTLAVFPSLYVKKGTKVNLVRSATSSGVAFTFYKLGYDS